LFSWFFTIIILCIAQFIHTKQQTDVRLLVLQLSLGHNLLVVVVDVLRLHVVTIHTTTRQRTDHLPHLHDVVLGHARHDPRLVLIPRKVADFGRVAAVDELQGVNGWRRGERGISGINEKNERE
jgi:hypothetical protein